MVDTASGEHVQAVCDVGNGACRPDLSGTGKASVNPNQVALDPNKRYYISVLPGDAANDTDVDSAHSMPHPATCSSSLPARIARTC